MTDQASKPRVVGEVVMKPLDLVTKNSWNPNAMTDFEKASLKEGLLRDGWLISQALLIWGSDDKGEEKNIIIDGEHRWFAATELNFGEGPMVFLHNMPEAEAKALTIKMDAKRGKFREEPLAKLLKEIQYDLGSADLSLGVGIPEEELMKMLAYEPVIITPNEDPEQRAPVVAAPEQAPQMQAGHVKLVQLFFGEKDYDAFVQASKNLAESYRTKNISETVLAAVKHAEADIDPS